MTTQAKASPSFATASTSSSSSFLVLVLDLNPLPCTQASSSHDILSILIPSVLVFLNAHLALSHSNGVAVYACSTGGLAKLIYSTASHSHNAKYTERESSQALQDASTYQHFALLGKAVVQGIKATLSEMEAADKIKENARPPEEEETALVKVLSMALNREFTRPSRRLVEARSSPSPMYLHFRRLALNRFESNLHRDSDYKCSLIF